MVWSGEPSGEFLTSTKEFYKQLWGLNLPGKIKITIWRISWNYLPTFVSMKHKKLIKKYAVPVWRRGRNSRPCVSCVPCVHRGMIWVLISGEPGFLVDARPLRSVFSVVRFGLSGAIEIPGYMNGKLKQLKTVETFGRPQELSQGMLRGGFCYLVRRPIAEYCPLSPPKPLHAIRRWKWA
ncbi:hypothetical protein GOBAR_DD27544 [Gossypium barbadense]|nr:hypothetical protein GOBAR_DD27544 [Gossypium barbadense]